MEESFSKNPESKIADQNGSRSGDRSGSSHVGWLVASVAVLVLSTLYAFWIQKPFPDVDHEPQFPSFDWWRYPVEKNPSMRLPDFPSKDLLSVHYSDSSHGEIISSDGTIFTTEDAGTSWQAKRFSTLLEFRAFFFPISKDTGPAAGWAVDVAGSFYRISTDGAGSRKLVPFSQTFDKEPALISALYFTNENKGWAIGETANSKRLAELRSNLDEAKRRYQELSGLPFPFPVINHSSRGELMEQPQFSTTDPEELNELRELRALIPNLANQLQSESNKTPSYAGIYQTSDGASKWTFVSHLEPENIRYSSLCFVDDQNGWAVGNQGYILYTINGGKNWEKQDSKTDANLISVYFATGGTGWAVGESGTILTTANRGTNWERRNSGTSARLTSIHFVDSRVGWVVGSDGVVIKTIDGGETWHRQCRAKNTARDAVFFVDSETGYRVGKSGTILKTPNGGSRWDEQISGTLRDLHAVYFLDSLHGWAGGVDGRIVKTDDGGQTWGPLNSPTKGNVAYIYFIDPKIGWIIGSNGNTSTTTNGGKDWNDLPPDSQKIPGLIVIESKKESRGAAGRGVTALLTGTAISALPLESGDKVLSADFLDKNIGWVGTDRGAIFKTSDGGKTWIKQETPTQASLSSIYFLNPSTGWAAGAGGIVLRTSTGGDIWEKYSTGLPYLLRGICFTNANHGWAFSTDVSLSTSDGGKTWREASPYRHYTPPLYYPLLGLAFALFVPFLRERDVGGGDPWVSNVFLSDRPLKSAGQDCLDSGFYARGICNYLRNAKTLPPLTIAVTGPWGSGKSSLMNLLMAELSKFGFKPVWFNAWHHQQENHLLASLLTRIRSQALPEWWTGENIAFRSNLLMCRVRKHILWTGFVLFVSPALVTYVLYHSPQALIEKHLSTKETLDPWEILKLIGLNAMAAGGIIPALLLLRKVLKGFGVDPAALLVLKSGGASVKDLQLQTSFRDAFAAEFKEVTEALNPRTLLLVIDDLDRCQPPSVLQILESINFLSSAGDCFVVLGIDEARVRDCIAYGFKDLGDILLDIDPSDDFRVRKKKQRDFAQRYMEKLIQIRVPIPPTNEGQAYALVEKELLSLEEKSLGASGDLLSGNHDKALTPEEDVPMPPKVKSPFWNQHRFFLFKSVVSPLIPFFVVAGLILSGVIVGGLTPRLTSHESTLPTPAPSSVINPSPTVVPAPVPIPSGSLAPSPTLSGSVSSSSPALPESQLVLNARKVHRAFWWLPLLVLTLILGLAGWWISRPPNPVVIDSAAFTAKLKLWLPLVLRVNPTLRNVKRFINKVRFYAMLMRDERGKDGKPVISDEVLVGYGAIEDCCPGVLRGPDTFRAESAAAKLPLALRKEARRIREMVDSPELKKYFDRLTQSFDTF